jgi:hypothetical protein
MLIPQLSGQFYQVSGIRGQESDQQAAALPPEEDR